MRIPRIFLAVLVLGTLSLAWAALKYSGRSAALLSWLQPAGPGSGAPEGTTDLTLLPRIQTIPDFKLVESDGTPMSMARLRGKVWVASFIFTHCASTCPLMALKIQSLQAILPDGVLLVSFSADPERDTPEVLRKYGEFQNRRVGKWLLCTGTWDEISHLAEKGFFLGGSEPLLHSTRFALVDQLGNLRGYYDSQSDAEIARLVRDVNLLQVEGKT